MMEKLMSMFHRGDNWTPPEDMKRAQQELNGILRRLEAEISVRRNYYTNTYGERNRDRNTTDQPSRVRDNGEQPPQRDTS